LFEDVCGNHRFVVRHDAAGIDESESLPVPVRFAVDSIARDAGFIADDCASFSDESIEQRRFADVGAANDRDKRQGFPISWHNQMNLDNTTRLVKMWNVCSFRDTEGRPFLCAEKILEEFDGPSHAIALEPQTEIS
jgi:hypothetical protein